LKGENKVEPKYTIGGKNFVFGLTLEQDELLGVMAFDMISEVPDSLTGASDGMINVANEKTSKKEKLTSMVSVAMDMIKVHAWIYKKGYARKILAAVLIPEGSEFDASKVDELERFFSKNATREIANEVINFFFTRSGAFGVGMPVFSPEKSTK